MKNFMNYLICFFVSLVFPHQQKYAFVFMIPAVFIPPLYGMSVWIEWQADEKIIISVVTISGYAVFVLHDTNNRRIDWQRTQSDFSAF